MIVRLTDRIFPYFFVSSMHSIRSKPLADNRTRDLSTAVAYDTYHYVAEAVL